MLDLSSFQDAITQLETSLEYVHSPLAQNDSRLAQQLQAASIQAFEFTYELSWKLLKRHLEMTEPNPNAIDELSFQNLIRTGNEKNLLLSDWETWRNFRTARGTTSHTYNSVKATEVSRIIPQFLKEAQFLLKKLSSHHHHA